MYVVKPTFRNGLLDHFSEDLLRHWRTAIILLNVQVKALKIGSCLTMRLVHGSRASTFKHIACPPVIIQYSVVLAMQLQHS